MALQHAKNSIRRNSHRFISTTFCWPWNGSDRQARNKRITKTRN